MNRPKSAALFAQNRRYLPGGVASLNRKVEPEIAFVRGRGAYRGNRFEREAWRAGPP